MERNRCVRPVHCFDWSKVLLIGYAITSLFSTCLYLFLAGGTAEFFGTPDTPEIRGWINIVAAGDVLLAFICIEALRLSQTHYIVKPLAFRAAAIYLLFHMTAFFINNVERDPYGSPGYIICIVVALAAAYHWGSYDVPDAVVGVGERDGLLNLNQLNN